MKSLNEIFQQEQISAKPEDLKVYGTDWSKYSQSKASFVVWPKNTEQVQKLVCWARENKKALVPSGGRTGLSGAAIATA